MFWTCEDPYLREEFGIIISLDCEDESVFHA